MVGGGYSGLWTAVLAKERDPSRDVVLLEGDRIGWAASGRNGGFCAASLTHGKDNGAQRFPDEIDTLERLGRQNLDRDRVGGRPLRHRLRLRADRRARPSRPSRTRSSGCARPPTRGRRSSTRTPCAPRSPRPTYLAGLWERDNNALVDPARLAWGLADAAERLGVRIHEDTPVTDLDRDGAGVAVRTAPATRSAPRRVALGTNAFPSLVRRRALAHRAGLRLRADDRAAVGRAAGLGRLAQPAGHRRLRQPVPLLPADRRQPDPVGRLRRDLPLRPPDVRPASTSGRRPSSCWPAVLRDLPAARGPAVHPPVGWRHRHLHPVLRLLRHGVRRPRGVRRSATPASASAPPGSAPT